MTFLEFSQSLQQLEDTSARLEMTYQLADLFKKLSVEETAPALYLMQGKLVPPYLSKEFNLSTKMLQRVLARLVPHREQGQSTDLFGQNLENETQLEGIVKLYKKRGDLGVVAQEVIEERSGRSSGQLTIIEVFDRLCAIAEDGGTGSQERKVEGLMTLLEKVQPVSAKYIVRIVIGKLRLGFSTMTMIDALSWAQNGDKSESKDLELAYQKKADLGKLAGGYLAESDKEKRLAQLEAVSVEAGIPVVPALCQRLNSSEEIIEKMEEVYAEPKFDGLRVQIHFKKTDQGVEVRAFTRNLEDVSHMFPELQQAVSILQCQSCVLDSEAIGFDPHSGELVEFQKTMTRKRKHDIGKTAQSVPIRFYVFDVLELDGTSFLEKGLRKRKDVLKNLFSDNEVFFETDYIITTDPTKLRTFHEEQLDKGLEGAVMKKVDSVYISGRKGWSWVKIKEEEGSTGKLSDTLDVVVMGYYYGRGKRNQFGIGAVLVGVLDQEEQVKTIAKIGTGLTEEQLKIMKQKCDEQQVITQPKAYLVQKNLVPDVWVNPAIVIEVAADEITKSPTHSAGVALRFPRMLQFREDKRFEDITQTSELASISHLR